MTLAVAKALIESERKYENLNVLAINNMVEVGRKYQQCVDLNTDTITKE